MWARVKGESFPALTLSEDICIESIANSAEFLVGRTELELTRLPHIQSYSFRPAFIVPLTLPPPEHRTRYNTPFFQFLGKVTGSISSSGAVGADVLAKGMIRACLEGGGAGGLPGWEGKGKAGDAGAFENSEIRRLGGGLAAA